MKKHTLLVISIISVALAIYFGLHTKVFVAYGERPATDWGKVVLTAVFGFGGLFCFLSYLKMESH